MNIDLYGLYDCAETTELKIKWGTTVGQIMEIKWDK